MGITNQLYYHFYSEISKATHITIDTALNLMFIPWLKNSQSLTASPFHLTMYSIFTSVKPWAMLTTISYGIEVYEEFYFNDHPKCFNPDSSTYPSIIQQKSEVWHQNYDVRLEFTVLILLFWINVTFTRMVFYLERKCSYWKFIKTC